MIKYFLMTALLSIGILAEVKEIETDFTYGERKIPVKIYLPAKLKAKTPLIVYSHGLGGSRNTKKYLMEHWSKAGFICITVQHPGSDEDVWKKAGRGQRFSALRKAASAEQFLNRVKDIPAVLNQIEKWNADKKHVLYKKVDLKNLGMCGHSFGASTSQAMMGANYFGGRSYHEKRFKAFILMSPSPAKGVSQTKAFGSVKSPVFSMTGTEDTSVITPGTGYKERQKVYENLPKGDKYSYVFEGGKHNLFSGPSRFSRTMKNEHKIIQKTSLLFWKAYLKDDKKAKAELKKPLKDPKPNPKDEFKFK